MIYETNIFNIKIEVVLYTFTSCNCARALILYLLFHKMIVRVENFGDF